MNAEGRRDALQEIALRVRRVDRPEVVREDVEDAEDEHEERRGPLGFEAYRNHDARSKTNDGDEDSRDGPFALQDEADEKEYEKNAARE